MKSTQTNTEKEAQGGHKRQGGGGGGHRDAQRELPEQPSCWVSLFYRLFPSDPPPSSLSLALALLFLIFLVYCKQNKTQSKHTFPTQRERGGGGTKRGRANTFVCKYEKFKAHTLSVLKHALIQTHTHTPTLTHTHMWTFTHSHTHISRRTHVGYLMLFSIQATLFAAAFAAPSRVFIFSHPLKQPLQSPCI